MTTPYTGQDRKLEQDARRCRICYNDVLHGEYPVLHHEDRHMIMPLPSRNYGTDAHPQWAQPQPPHDLFDDSETANVVITCHGAVFYAHQHLVEASPVFKNAIPPGARLTGCEIDMDGFKPRIVEMALRSLYGLPIGPQPAEDHAIFWAEVFGLAEYLDIPYLRRRARLEYVSIIEQAPDPVLTALKSAQAVFEDTPTGLRDLRDIAISVLTKNGMESWMTRLRKEGFTLVDNAPSLAAELLYHLYPDFKPYHYSDVPHHTPSIWSSEFASRNALMRNAMPGHRETGGASHARDNQHAAEDSQYDDDDDDESSEESTQYSDGDGGYDLASIDIELAELDRQFGRTPAHLPSRRNRTHSRRGSVDHGQGFAANHAGPISQPQPLPPHGRSLSNHPWGLLYPRQTAGY